MYHRRPRIKQEKSFQERLAEEVGHLNDQAEGMKRTPTSACRSEGMPLDEIFGTEEISPVKGEPLVRHPNLKLQMLLSEKIVLAAAGVAVVLVYLLLYELIGTD